MLMSLRKPKITLLNFGSFQGSEDPFLRIVNACDCFSVEEDMGSLEKEQEWRITSAVTCA